VILLPFAVGVALAPYLARHAPPRYRSEALIVVIPQQVPDEYVKPTVNQTLDERLPAITDQILSRSRLERIIQELDLYKTERDRNVMEDVVATMRQDISTSADGKNVDSFRISYASDNPQVAQKVTERLASLYIDQNTEDRKAQADHTSEFLAAQLANAKRRLIEQERKLEEYRKQHAGEMPSQMSGNLQAIQNANMQLQAVNESTNRAQEHRLLIERQIADAQPATDAASATPGQEPSPSNAAAGSDAPAPMSAAGQLEAARARRAFLLQRFTADYPEIVRLNQTIADLTTRVEAQALAVPVDSTPAPASITPAEAAQRKKIQDLRTELAAVDYELEVNRVEAARLKASIEGYQAKVDAVPTRESELVELTRDYGTLQTAYNSLLMKSEDSAIAANLERGKISEQFKLVDEASRPERPFNDRQRRIMTASGAAVGLGLGLLIVLGLELLDSSFKRGEEVSQTLSLPVLAAIPVMRSDSERRSITRRRRIMDAAGAACLVAAAVVLVLWRR
jgi:polysaccharide chain length determinant protein (PEP-CTERM system associated)